MRLSTKSRLLYLGRSNGTTDRTYISHSGVVMITRFRNLKVQIVPDPVKTVPQVTKEANLCFSTEGERLLAGVPIYIYIENRLSQVHVSSSEQVTSECHHDGDLSNSFKLQRTRGRVCLVYHHTGGVTSSTARESTRARAREREMVEMGNANFDNTAKSKCARICRSSG